MDSTFHPDINFLRGVDLSSSLLNLSPDLNQNHKRDLFGALIRKKFDSSSRQYKNIELLSLSFPTLSLLSEPPQLRFPSSTSQSSQKYFMKDTSKIDGKISEETQNQNHKKNVKYFIKSKMNEELLRPYLSMTSQDDFHNVYYTPSIKSSSEREIIRYSILALQGFESDLFQYGSNLHRRIVCPGHSFLSLSHSLTIYYKYLIIRRLFTSCTDSFIHVCDPIYSALKEVVMDLLVVLDSYLQFLLDSYQSNSSKGLNNLLVDTRIYRLIVLEISQLCFPMDIMNLLDESQYYLDERNNVSMISYYFIPEHWNDFHRSRDGYNILRDIISKIFQLTLSSSSIKSYDIYPTSSFEHDSNIWLSELKEKSSDSFLKFLVSCLFLKKLSKCFMEVLSNCLFRFSVHMPSSIEQNNIHPSESLRISIHQLSSVMISGDSIDGQDVMEVLLSTYIWSIHRLNILRASSILSFEHMINICGDKFDSLFFPLHDMDINILSVVHIKAKNRLKRLEKKIFDIIFVWKESSSFHPSLTKSGGNDISNGSNDDNNVIKMSTIEHQEKVSNEILTTSLEKSSSIITSNPSKSLQTIDFYQPILPNASYLQDKDIFHLAKSSILQKYADLTLQVDRRRATLHWKQYRAENMQSCRNNLKLLYQSDIELWKRNMIGVSLRPESSNIVDANLKLESMSNSFRIEPLPSVKSIHSGIRMLGQAPGGNSSFRFSYDDDATNTMKSSTTKTSESIEIKYVPYKTINYKNDHDHDNNNNNNNNQNRDNDGDDDTINNSNPGYDEVKSEQIVLHEQINTTNVIQSEHSKTNMSEGQEKNIDEVKLSHSNPTETLIDDLHGNLISIKSIYSGLRVNQAPGGDSNLNLADGSELEDTFHSDPYNLPSVRSIHSGIRINQAPGGFSEFSLANEDQVIIEKDENGKELNKPLNARPPTGLVRHGSIRSIHSGVRVNQAPGGNSSFSLRHDYDNNDSNSINSKSGTISKFNQGFDGGTITTNNGSSSSSQLASRTIDSIDNSNDDTNDGTNDDDDFDLLEKLNEDVSDDTTEDDLSSEDDNTDSNIDHSIRSKSNNRSVDKSNRKKLTKKIILKDRESKSSNDDAESVTIETTTLIKKPVQIDQKFAEEVARKLYYDGMRNNEWMNLYDLVYPSHDYFEEEDCIHDLFHNIHHTLIRLSRNHNILSSDSSNSSSSNYNDTTDDDEMLALAKPMDMVFRTSLLSIVTIQSKVIDYATIYMALDQCKILQSIDRIEDIFMISDRSDSILFVSDYLIESYLSDTKNYFSNMALNKHHQSNIINNRDNKSMLHTSSIWTSDLLNKSLQRVFRLSSSKSNSDGYSPTFQVVSHPYQPVIMSSENVVPTEMLSISPLHAIFYTNGLHRLRIGYNIIQILTQDQLSHSARKVIHDTIFSRDVLDTFSFTCIRLLELGQLRSLLRMIFIDLRQRRIKTTGSKVQTIDRQLFHAYEQVRCIVQSICDFMGDRLRVLRIKFKDSINEFIVNQGMAGLVLSVEEYSFQLAKATFSFPTEEDSRHYNSSFLHSVYDVEVRSESKTKLTLEGRSLFSSMEIILASARRMLNMIHDVISMNHVVVTNESVATSSSSIIHKIEELDISLAEMQTYKLMLIHNAVKEFHMQSPEKDHCEALLMYLGASHSI